MVGEFLGRWVVIASAEREWALAKVAAGEHSELSAICDQEVILTSLANLQTFPWISGASKR